MEKFDKQEKFNEFWQDLEKGGPVIIDMSGGAMTLLFKEGDSYFVQTGNAKRRRASRDRARKEINAWVARLADDVHFKEKGQ